MRKKTPRAICLDILDRVEKAGAHPDRLLSDSFKRYRYLTSLDRAFLTELTYGVIRWKGRLDWVICQFSKIPFEKIEPEILHILRLGLYQLFFLTKTPPSAAVNESVELAKRTRGKGGSGFINAVLRSALRQKEEIHYPDFCQDPVLHLSVVQSHPSWLVQRWVKELGAEDASKICTFNNRISPLTLRTNTLKLNRKDLVEKLKGKGLGVFPALFSEVGIMFQDAPPTSELPFMKGGFYIIQDEASQMVTTLLDPKPGERILDACAAPGGKTTHMAQRMENRGEIYALDIKREKLALISEMCRRLEVKIVKTIRGDAASSLPVPKSIMFNRVLADVPCSGFGTLRKNPDLKWRRTGEDIRRLGELQSSILRNLSGYVKEGGVLVYSTCTVFHEENEDVIEAFLGQHPEFQMDRLDRILPRESHLFIRDGYFKTFPPQDDMDGFFAARLLKRRAP